MKGKLLLSFIPDRSHIPTHRKFPELSYYLARYSYGYVASVEQWAKLRNPNEFPSVSDWIYKTSYLTFQDSQNTKRVFFPYAVTGRTLVTEPGGLKNWKVLAEEKCDYLKPSVIYNLQRDNWSHSGQFEIDFMGIDSLETPKDIVQFLF
jgi:hypothetical protein